jgi:hypothetical protein
MARDRDHGVTGLCGLQFLGRRDGGNEMAVEIVTLMF